MLFLFSQVLFGESEVNHVNLGNILLSTYQEVIWFNIAVKHPSRVYEFYQL